MSEHLKRWSPTARMEEIGKRPVGYMIGDKRGQWCWADIAEKQIATLTAERDALSAVLQQGADADVDLRKRYEALEKENAELRAQVARLDWQPITPENLPKVGDEVYGKYCGDVHKVTNAMEGWGAEKLEERCFHYFRPINPPSRTAKEPA